MQHRTKTLPTGTLACNIEQKHSRPKHKHRSSTSVIDFGHLGRPPGWGEGLPGDDSGDDQHGVGDHGQHGEEGQNCCHLGCGRHQDYHCVVL